MKHIIDMICEDRICRDMNPRPSYAWIKYSQVPTDIGFVQSRNLRWALTNCTINRSNNVNSMACDMTSPPRVMQSLSISAHPHYGAHTIYILMNIKQLLNKIDI